MALVDIGHDWDLTGEHGSVEYQNGESVSYTYATSGLGINGHTALGPAASASIDFDVPASGVSINVGGMRYENSYIERFNLEIDGQLVNFDDMIADGSITITGSDAIGDGSNLIYNGHTFRPDLGSLGAGNQFYTLTFNIPISSVQLTNNGTATASEMISMDVSIEDTAPQAVSSPCFTAGTLIDTDHGPVKVEDLQIGDKVKTMDHGFQPIRWVGCSPTYAHGNKAPVRIKAGVFGNTRDLVVSPRHRMLLKGWQMALLFNHEQALACAGDMVNDSTITREPAGMVDYYHILFDRHEIIYAEGAATESFHPDSDIDAFGKSTRDELLELFPELATQGYGAPVRHTINALQAFYVKHNLEMLD